MPARTRRWGGWLRFIGAAGAAAALTLAAFGVGVRFYLLPRIDEYRPALERYATRVMRTPVHVARIEARWGGLRPHLEVSGLRVQEESGADALSVPHAVLSLSWRSLITWRLDLSELRIEGASLRAHRDASGVWTVAERRVERNADGGRLLDNPAWQWLLQQPRMSAHDVTLVLEDERIAPHRWVFSHLEASTRRQGLANVRFEASARPPAGYGGELRAQGRLSPTLAGRLDRTAPRWSGQATLEIDRLDLAAVAGLFPDESVRAQGVMDAQGSIAFTDLELGAWSADLSWTDAMLGVARGAARLGQGAAQLRGAVHERALAGALHLREGLLELPTVFEAAEIPVHALDGQLDVRFDADNGLRIGFEDVRVDAGEPQVRMDVAARGAWRPGGRTRAGVLELEAATEAADAAAIARYMPRVVGPGTRRWLREGIAAGRLQDVRAVVRGDLADFPFDRHPESGDFRIEGRVADAVIDVAPHAPKRWPPFEAVNGRVSVHRASLQAEVESAEVRRGLPQPVPIRQAQVRIPDLHAGAVMTVQGEASGPAESFLAYVGQTRLADFTGHFLSQARASGALRVPATVVVPFQRLHDITVAGEVELAGNAVRLHPAAPPIADARGSVTFTHDSVGVHGLSGRFLGRALRAEGVMPLAGGQGIVVQGGLEAAALRKQWDYPWLARLSGATDFTARIASGPRGPELALTSDLVGLGLALPAPLGKTAAAAWPLQAGLTRGQDAGTRRLDVALPQARFALAAEFGADTGMRPLRASLGMGADTAPGLPQDGLRLDLRAERIDLGEWGGTVKSLIEEAGAQAHAGTAAAQNGKSRVQQTRPGAAGSRRPGDGGADAGGGGLADWLARAPVQARLRAGRADAVGLRLDRLDVDARRLDGERWRARVQARQADGTVEAIGPGRELRGSFARLALQRVEPGPARAGAPADEDDGPSLDYLPDIALDVADFSYGDWSLGRLRLRAANRSAAPAGWRVRQLRIENPAAVLEATGDWRAPARSLQRRRTTFDLSLDVRDGGALAARLGLPGTLAGGTGYVKGSIGWEGHPFSYDPEGLDMHLGIALDGGSFLRAPDTRLLGILSLQALARTAAFQPGNLFESGFAWDHLRAEVSATRGAGRLESFSLQGPSATVVMSGALDLVRQRQDLHAVIIPHVDASAAALLAGVAINPLVGAGAFLAQLLLREPLARALTFEYRIAGTWTEPELERLSGP